MRQILASGDAQTVVADVDWSRFKPAYEAHRVRPMLSSLGGGTAKPAPDLVGSTDETLAVHLATAAPAQRREQLRALIRREVAAVLGLGAEALPDLRAGFFELGMDSLTSLQLRRRLEDALGRQLPSTVAFKYPTIEAMASYLAEEPASADIAAAGSPAPDARQMPPLQTQTHDEAQIGGEADETEDELFDRLAARLSRRRA
jgi:myxalamid-type polyketide synthase MxaE and MxaD